MSQKPFNNDDRTFAQIAIDPHREEVVPWSQAQRQGSKDDRMTTEVTVSLPPKIHDYRPNLPLPLASQAESALSAIARLDSTHGPSLEPLSVLFLRAESVASSEIEQLHASMDDFARAAHGSKSNESATAMVASSKALDALIRSVENHGNITVDNILWAHRVLMQDDPQEQKYAGKVRDMQNWIGGSDYAPRNASNVPPPAETVEGYLEDLVSFANRDDIPALVQAAVVHAQFESIHPFTDGNGRIGRALINTVLRRRGVTSRVVVPLASSLVAHREIYFSVLNAYRGGDAGPIVEAIARASHIAARESQVSAEVLSTLHGIWLDMYAESTGRAPRANSAARKIVDHLLSIPFFTAEEMESTIGSSTTSVYDAINALERAAILRPLTSRTRNQVWCASLVVEELDDLGTRIATETTADPFWFELQRHASSNSR